MSVSFELVNKWLHSKENNQNIIDILINMKNYEVAKVNVADFQKVDNSVKTISGLEVSLNEFFKMHDYPFKANYEVGYIYINQSKRMYCIKHGKFFKTEEDLKKHQKCSLERLVRPREERPDNIIIEEGDRETEEERKKRIEEERKAIEGLYGTRRKV